MDVIFRSYLLMNEVGICFWIFVKNVDNDRVFRELWEVKCVCCCGVYWIDCL